MLNLLAGVFNFGETEGCGAALEEMAKGRKLSEVFLGTVS